MSPKSRVSQTTGIVNEIFSFLRCHRYFDLAVKEKTDTSHPDSNWLGIWRF